MANVLGTALLGLQWVAGATLPARRYETERRNKHVENKVGHRLLRCARKGELLTPGRTRRPSPMPTYTELDRMRSKAIFQGNKGVLDLLQEYRKTKGKRNAHWLACKEGLIGLQFTSFGYTR